MTKSKPETPIPDGVRAWLSYIGSAGGRAGSRADKIRAVNLRWSREKARKKARTKRKRALVSA